MQYPLLSPVGQPQPPSAPPVIPASTCEATHGADIQANFTIFPASVATVRNTGSVVFGALAATTATLTYTALGWTARIASAVGGDAPQSTLMPVLVTGALIGGFGSAITAALLAGAFATGQQSPADRPCDGRLTSAVLSGLAAGAATGLLVAYSGLEASRLSHDAPNPARPRESIEPWRLSGG